eukprot:1046289-Karenia_brevis.AAC.1
MLSPSMLRWKVMLEGSGRWRFSPMCVDQVIHHYRKILRDFAPRFLQDGGTTFSRAHIPTMHFT